MNEFFTPEEIRRKIFPYSKQAFADGYDFTDFTSEEQNLTKYYYTNVEDMRELNRNYNSASYYIKEGQFVSVYRALYDIGWGFYNFGEYDGVIVGCYPTAKKDSCEYILDVLILEHCIRHIKFNPINNSVITEAIKEEFGDISREILSNLIGKWVQISVSNKKNDQSRYSYINKLLFYSDESMEIYKKMFERMFDFKYLRNRLKP